MPDPPISSTAQPLLDASAPDARTPRRFGVVVHPSRSVERPLRLLREWTEERGVEVLQVPAAYNQRHVAEPGDPREADLIVSIGGDGTTLAALRTGVEADRPVLGIACGSLGALATVSVSEITASLDRFSRGDWTARRFPALSVQRPHDEPLFALNDVTVVRAGGGQVRVTARLDGNVYARMAGDGAIVSTPIGSSGYAISAGGPLLAPGLDAFVFTPLPKHGGFSPPLVIGPDSVLQLDIEAGFGGARLEIDGQVAEPPARSLAISLRQNVATMVSFPDQEGLFAGLRRRRIILDSPRIQSDAPRDPGGCPD